MISAEDYIDNNYTCYFPTESVFWQDFRLNLYHMSIFCSQLDRLGLKGIYPDVKKKKIFSPGYLLCVNILHAQCMQVFPSLQKHCEEVIKAVCFSSTFCLFFLFIIRCDDTFACVASHRWHRNFVIKW